MAKRKDLPGDILQDVAVAAGAPRTEKRTAPGPGRPPAEKKRVPLMVRMDAELADRLKNIVYWTGRPRLTVTGLVEEGIRKVVGEWEKTNGGPYPPREGNIPGGQPIK